MVKYENFASLDIFEIEYELQYLKVYLFHQETKGHHDVVFHD